MGAEKSCAARYQSSHSCSPASAPILARDGADGFDHVRDVGIRHRGVYGQRQASAEDVLGDGEIAVAIAVHALVVVHRVQRDAVHGASDAALAQHLDELVAAELEALGADAQDVEMPG